MTYTFNWSKQSEKFLDKLPPELAKRIVIKVNLMKDNPFHFVEHFDGENYFKIRIGDYRVLLDIDSSLKLIEIRVIGHRGNIYKRI